MSDDLRYDLYGLPAGNPYAARPLDPLALPADRELVLELAGFIRLEVIEAAVKEAISKGRPAYFLITGVGNSGRTSLANHAMYLYQQAAASLLPPGFTFVTHRAERGDMTHDAYAVLCSTLLSLRNKMNAQGIDIPPALRAHFSTLSERGAANPMNEYDLQEIAEFTATTFAGRNAGFGIRYEGVPAKELITQAQKVFENTSTVVVFVIDSYQHANTVQITEADRQAFAERGHVFDLDTLTPEQIAALAEFRWKGHPPAPFDEQGVKNVFSKRPYTIGQAIQHLEVLLDLRLSEYESDVPWPAAEDLRIHERWVRLKIWQRDRWNRLRGFHG
ncbi:hypothetical protein [Nonomuraea sp. NPDC048901]|uniref:hypothetical protein n=1 Tax=Nonomuraea sp. NPDC048901 TaxID=3155627 RepID=UPI0033C60190